jgi:hypothetical protein
MLIAAIGEFLLAPTPAVAQTSPSTIPVGYVSGGVLVSMQRQGNSDCPYLCDPFGGTAWGLAVGSAGESATT